MRGRDFRGGDLIAGVASTKYLSVVMTKDWLDEKRVGEVGGIDVARGCLQDGDVIDVRGCIPLS